MNLGIKNKTVLIIGASKGLGKETANAFAREGCKLILVARNIDLLKKCIRDLPGNQQHKFLAFDLMNAKQLKAFILKLKNEDIDIVINNLGGALGFKDPLSRAEMWKKVWQFNVGIGITINNEVIPSMIEKNWGRIVHVSSSYSLNGGVTNTPFGGSPQYSAAKAYLNMYVKTVARELANQGVIINSVLPGPLHIEGKHWDKVRNENPELYKKFVNETMPIGRLGSPKEIAPFILMLASSHATFATGSMLSLDGGSLS
ncbi:SDR family oxidoreductase [Gammaproteobacteria bacterium]|nr:SDR family oxidoreductase [Gammaproteobacteria bacterium]